MEHAQAKACQSTYDNLLRLQSFPIDDGFRFCLRVQRTLPQLLRNSSTGSPLGITQPFCQRSLSALQMVQQLFRGAAVLSAVQQ